MNGDLSHQNHKNNLENNQIQVFGMSDIACVPDVVKISITITSTKSNPEDSKNSVKRRQDYVMQCISNLHLKQSEVEESSFMKKNDAVFNYTVLIWVSFTNFKKCQALMNLLEEKLDRSVVIKGPFFSHSKPHIEATRQKASMAAIEHSRSKAAQIAQHLGNKLSRPLWLKEDDIREENSDNSVYPKQLNAQMGDNNSQETSSEFHDSWEAGLRSATVNIQVKVCACYEMTSKKIDIL